MERREVNVDDWFPPVWIGDPISRRIQKPAITKGGGKKKSLNDALKECMAGIKTRAFGYPVDL